MSMLAAQPATCSPDTRVRVTERLLIAGLRAQERADESEAARGRIAFLFKASQRLAQSLEPATVLDAVLNLLVPELADAASVHMLPSNRGAAHTTSAISEAVADRPAEWWSWLERTTRPSVNRAIGFGVSDCATAASKPRSNRIDGLQFSYIVVPLRAHGQTLGALRIVSVGSRRRHRPDDQGLLEAFAGQAGLALENARLFQEQRALVTRLEEVRGQFDTAQNDWLRDDERRRIARDLHDYVEQTFFAIGLTAAAALEARSAPASVTDLTDALRRAVELSATGAEQLRSAIFALKQRDYSPVGLVATLRSLVHAFEKRTGVDADLVVSGPEPDLTHQVGETVFAVAHEALANVERHADASSVVLTLHFRPRTITLAINDDGAGVSRLIPKGNGSSTKHFGLAGLRERVRGLNGSLSAGPGPNGGFLLRTRIPLTKEANR